MVKEAILGLDKNEKVLHEVKRHSVGLIEIWAGTGILIVLTLGGMVALGANDGLSDWAVLFFGAFIFLMVLFGWIGTSIYKSNELILTNENIIQILQFGLFNRQVSQLNLAKIQDVSVDQKGILQNTLSYGVIEIETAGEAANFRFKFTPQPNLVAKLIIEAHEEYMKHHRRDHTI